MYLLNPFIVQNKKKKPENRPTVMKTYHFWAKMTKLPPPPKKNFFFKKSINITYLYLCNSFIMQNCKTILTVDPELWGHTILGPKLPICPKYFFYRKAINIISMYLSAPFIVQNLKNP